MAASAPPNPSSPALYHCTNADCGGIWAREQVLRERFGEQEVLLCPACRLGVNELIRSPSFGARVPSAFQYPLAGDGVWILVSGTVLFAFLELASRIGFILSYLASAFLWGYFGMLLLDVVRTTAAAEHRSLEWPDFSGFDEIVGSALQIVGSVLLVFGPALVCWIYASAELAANTNSATGGWLMLLALTLGLVGLLYYPMAFLALAMFDALAALNPLRVLSAIARSRTHYALVLVLLIGLYLVRLAIGTAINWLPWWWQLALLLPVELVVLYSLIVSARLLGLLYRSNEQNFGWFR